METLAVVVNEAIASMGYVPNTPCILFVTPYGFIGAEPVLTLYKDGVPVHRDHKRLK